jgi:hypothetical protein
MMSLAVILAVCGTTAGAAQEPEMTEEQQAEMAGWMALAKPGEHHEHLAGYAGKWKTQIKMWMAPGAEPMLTESAAEAKWIFDGRFLEWHHSGEFFGSPYTGMGLDGYNNADERYESILLDNFGTLIVFYTGSCSDDGKVREMRGSFTNPMAGSVIEQRNVFSWIDNDHFKLESFMQMGDEEYKQMEMLYERQ